MRRTALTAVTALSLAAAAQAQPVFTPLIVQGDVVIDVGGAIFRIDSLAVNNHGSWLVEADTTSTDTTADQVVLKDGLNNVFAQEGMPLDFPPGSAISSFDSVGLNNNGDTGWNLFLRNLPTNADSGIFFNLINLVQEGFVSVTGFFQFPTPYIGFFEVKMNDSNQMLVMASVDDPSIPTTVDRAIVIFEFSPMTGGLVEQPRYKEGDVLNGQTEAVTDFGTGPHTMAINNSGSVMFVADLTGDQNLDGVIYIDSTLVAQEGSPAATVPGRNWRVLGTSTRLDLNNQGEGVWIGTLDGDTATDLTISTTTRRVVSEGDSLPAIAPFTITNFGTAPVFINDAGQVLWFGDWNDPDTTRDTGLFLDDRLLVQEGVTTIDVNGVPMLVQAVASVEGAFHMSDNGRYVIFECTLNDGFTNFNAAVLIDLGDANPCPADFNNDGSVDPDDLGDFINCYFAVPPCDGADFNSDGAIDPDDLGDFINIYFGTLASGGC